MKLKNLLPISSITLLMLAIFACVIPGQAVPPISTLGPGGVETAIASTAQAAAQQTEQAHPSQTEPTELLAQPSLPPEETLPATELPTQFSPSPEVISSYETSLVKLADGSTQFRDYRAGVQIIFPSGWLLMRQGEPEFYEAWEKLGSQSKWFLEEIGSIQSLDLNLFRVSAYDTHVEHTYRDTFPKINVVFLKGDTRTLNEVDANEKMLIERSVQAGHKHLSSDYQVLAGLDVLLFQSQWDSVSFPTTHYKGTFFRVPSGLMVIDFYIASEQQQTMDIEWTQIVESITLFTP
jgi:hypothetical protein